MSVIYGKSEIILKKLLCALNQILLTRSVEYHMVVLLLQGGHAAFDNSVWNAIWNPKLCQAFLGVFDEFYVHKNSPKIALLFWGNGVVERVS